MKWQNVLEAICAAPSIVLEQITAGFRELLIEEKDLVQNGEFDEEDMEEYQE